MWCIFTFFGELTVRTITSHGWCHATHNLFHWCNRVNVQFIQMFFIHPLVKLVKKWLHVQIIIFMWRKPSYHICSYLLRPPALRIHFLANSENNSYQHLCGRKDSPLNVSNPTMTFIIYYLTFTRWFTEQLFMDLCLFESHSWNETMFQAFNLTTKWISSMCGPKLPSLPDLKSIPKRSSVPSISLIISSI